MKLNDGEQGNRNKSMCEIRRREKGTEGERLPKISDLILHVGSETTRVKYEALFF